MYKRGAIVETISILYEKNIKIKALKKNQK